MDLKEVADLQSRNLAGSWRLILDQITTRRRSLREAVEGCLQAGAPTILHLLCGMVAKLRGAQVVLTGAFDTLKEGAPETSRRETFRKIKSGDVE